MRIIAVRGGWPGLDVPYAQIHKSSTGRRDARGCGGGVAWRVAARVGTPYARALLSPRLPLRQAECGLGLALPRHAPWRVSAAPRSETRQPRPRQRSAALVAATSSLLPRPMYNAAT